MKKRLFVMVMMGVFLILVANPNRSSATPQNFNGDVYADLAIGAPFEDFSTVVDGGATSVIYGTSNGLSDSNNEYWIQDYLSSSDAEDDDYFGYTLAVGDFDGDGCNDLAVGVPYEDIGTVSRAGAVNVIYGTSSGGLDMAGNQFLSQDVPGMGGAAEADDYFGRALTVGDFNGDGYDDLVIGVPFEDIGSIEDAGAIMVLYGSASGLIATATVWDQDGGVEAYDEYGATLAAGDFNNDGYDDLAVGIPGEDLGSIQNTGAVQIYYGSSGGIVERTANDFWHQDRSGMSDAAEANDFFGEALTTGDFNNDGYDDLAIGVPDEDIGSSSTITNAGAVNVLYGTEDGITAVNANFWNQDFGSIGSLSEENDFFGEALTAGDFDGDGYDDLVVGVPYEDWNDSNTGIVQIIYGSSLGLNDAGNQLWRQGASGIHGMEEPDDRYGDALAVGDFNGDGYSDLAIGIPYESITFNGSDRDDAGAVNVIYGSNTGLTATGNQLWYQGDGIQGTPEVNDRFGFALAALPRNIKRVYLPLILRN